MLLLSLPSKNIPLFSVIFIYILKMSSFYIYLSIHCLEVLANFKTLRDGTSAEDIEDGLLVSSKSLHGCPEGFRVGSWVKGVGRKHGRHALLSTKRLKTNREKKESKNKAMQQTGQPVKIMNKS